MDDLFEDSAPAVVPPPRTARIAKKAAAAPTDDDDAAPQLPMRPPPPRVPAPRAAAAAATESSASPKAESKTEATAASVDDSLFDHLDDAAVALAIKVSKEESIRKEAEDRKRQETIDSTTLLPCPTDPFRTAVGMPEAHGAAMDKEWIDKMFAMHPSRKPATYEPSDLNAQIANAYPETWFEMHMPHRFQCKTATQVKNESKEKKDAKKASRESGNKGGGGGGAPAAVPGAPLSASAAIKARAAAKKVAEVKSMGDVPYVLPTTAPVVNHGRADFVNVFDTGMVGPQTFRYTIMGPILLVHNARLGYGNWAGCKEVKQLGLDNTVKDLHDAKTKVLCYISEAPYKTIDDGETLYRAVRVFKSWLRMLQNVIFASAVRNRVIGYVATAFEFLRNGKIKAADDELDATMAIIGQIHNAADQERMRADAEAKYQTAVGRPVMTNEVVQAFINGHARWANFPLQGRPEFGNEPLDALMTEAKLFRARSDEEPAMRVYPTEAIRRVCVTSQLVWNPPGVYQFADKAEPSSWFEFKIPTMSLMCPEFGISIVTSDVGNGTFRINFEHKNFHMYAPSRPRSVVPVALKSRITLAGARAFGSKSAYAATNGWSEEAPPEELESMKEQARAQLIANDAAALEEYPIVKKKKHGAAAAAAAVPVAAGPFGPPIPTVPVGMTWVGAGGGGGPAGETTRKRPANDGVLSTA